MWTRTAALAVVAVAAGAAGGCTAATADKAGGETITLRFGTIDGEDRGREFADAIETASDGRIRVDVEHNYADGAAEAEAQIIEAIATGELDGGWPSTRAFAAAGIPGLTAVEAPMVITNYEAVAELVEGEASTTILAALDGTGVVGVGLAASPLRRPFAANAPLLDPDDWKGKSFRAYNSVTQEQAIRALGAAPVNLSFAWIDEVRMGRLDGAEFDVRGYWMNGYGSEAGNVTSNVVLWPKIGVLSLSQERWDALTDQQRAWIRDAAEASTAASVATDYGEDETAGLLCAQGLKFFAAAPEQLEALQAAFAPVIDALAADESTAPVLRVVLSAAERHPGIAEVNVPEACATGAFAPGVSSPEEATIPMEGAPPIPDGVYRVEITADEVAAAGLSNGPGWSGTWTMTIDDGTYALTCQPITAPGKDCGNVTYGQDGVTFDTVLEAGYLQGDDMSVVFAYDPEVHSQHTGCELPCLGEFELAFTWSMNGDRLQLVDVSTADPYHQHTLKPWTRIG